MLKSINQKALALSAAIVVLVGVCCGVSAWVMRGLVVNMEATAHSTLMMQNHMHSDMMHDALRADVLAAVVSNDVRYGISIDEVRTELQDHAKQFRDDMAENLGSAKTDLQKQIIGRLKYPLDVYIRGAEKTIELIAANPDAAAAAMPDFLKKFETLEGALSDASKQLEEEQANIAAEAGRMAQSAQMYLLAMLAAGLAAAAIITVAVRRTLVRPMLDMAAAMKRLSEGDVAVTIPSTSRKDELGAMASALGAFKEGLAERQRLEADAAVVHEKNEQELRRTEEAFRSAGREQTSVVGQLADALAALAAGDLTARIAQPVSGDYQRLKDDYNGAIDKLEKAMQEIAANIAGIRSGTLEISTASDDLSRRTEQQASSLEETAAALDEITATIKKAAEGAGHAREVVAAADADAKKSAVVVQQAVEAMDGIARSSQQISQIIGVIDEIAFQTNLLALNAGVEAARAGDAGRGFAVVASEVRALAQRSAEAAKEIKGLISASTTHVDHGIKLVGETGKSLQRIVTQVTEINDVVAAIAAGAKEQASGMEHINTAINEMDRVTQQNAAMVEEATAATHSLSKETGELAERVGQFRLKQGADHGGLRRELKKAAPHAFRASIPSSGGERGGVHVAVDNDRRELVAGAPTRSPRPALAAAANSGLASVGAEDGWEQF